MSFKNFRVQSLIRLLLIFVSLFGLVYYLFIEVNYIRVFFLGLFSLIILMSLFAYINRTNRDTRYFLEAILNNDFTIKYNSSNQGKTFQELYSTFNKVNDKFMESTQSDASQYQYILTLINQLQVGILAYDEKERIHLANNAFEELLGQSHILNLSNIRAKNEILFEQLQSIQNGENVVQKITINNQVRRLSISATTFRLRAKHYKLISLQDIHAELDQNEMEAWQKLIRVLTHEIMNSVAPITSLSSTMKQVVQQGDLQGQRKATLEEGLDAIEARSQGLMNFTQAYRALTRVPLPNIKEVDGPNFFQRISSLFEPTLADTQIVWKLSIPQEDFKLLIDPDLIEQVIINLLKNAKEAVDQNSGSISLSYQEGHGASQSTIKIVDNGSGISDDILEKVFIPFYTTKTEGSGIGLSLARQIIQSHKGELSLETSSSGTSFYIKL
ncbi:PAS domain-containing sensor histidine kinase [Roseivirga sp. E12]|uniref:sensor histidine kinase n=1 Tax=Roseivirga sp. E12 TaxID=2819237 RepID=UPI001ABD0F56|nr:ATP-binding protein [Roseivirga sp. E12]MBO3697437.1 GHKL domain-containing protein [Roseivirga sp. E12]